MTDAWDDCLCSSHLPPLQLRYNYSFFSPRAPEGTYRAEKKILYLSWDPKFAIFGSQDNLDVNILFYLVWHHGKQQ